MCIELTPVKYPTRSTRWVWKVFSHHTTSDTAVSSVFYYHTPRGQWVSSPQGPGFYAGLTQEAAKAGSFWDDEIDIIMKVRVRRVNGRSKDTITAEDIFIPNGRRRS